MATTQEPLFIPHDRRQQLTMALIAVALLVLGLIAWATLGRGFNF